MGRIDTTFKALKSQKKKAFISYIMAGDTDYEKSFEILTYDFPKWQNVRSHVRYICLYYYQTTNDCIYRK